MIRIVYGESFYENVSTELQPYLTFSARISLSEHYIYGSSRLGTRMVDKELYRNLLSYQGLSAPLLEQARLNLSQPAYNMACGCVEDPEQDSDEDEDTEQPGPGLPAYAHVYRHRVGYKQYELTNHASTSLSASLGNVLATVLDRRTGQLLQPSDTAYAWYQADVPSAQDYYPFGMQMPGRVYVADSTNLYRYGMNGQGKNDEIHGKGNSYTAEFWQYDARLGRRWNIDPVIKPWRSSYDALSNNPIIMVDPKGDDDYFNAQGVFLYRDNKTTDYVKVIINNKAYALTTLKIPFKDSKGHISQKALMSILNHYSVKTKVDLVMQDVNTMESYRKDGIAVHIAKDFKNGGFQINSILNTASNIENVFEHEEQHNDDKGTPLSYIDSELRAVMKQIGTDSWETTTKDFKEYIYNSYAGFFLTKDGAKYKSEFEEKTGITIEKTDKGCAKWEYTDNDKKE